MVIGAGVADGKLAVAPVIGFGSPGVVCAWAAARSVLSFRPRGDET